MHVSLLTGGGDRPYAVGLATVLIKKGLSLDIIGSDGLDSSDWHNTPGVRFLNLRGDQKVDADLATKVSRILIYYARLIHYAWSAEPKVFHILWNNRFESFDRTLLMLYYKLLRKRVVLTAHNVNKRKRDLTDTLVNRLTLRIQYRLCDHVFVHTEQMKWDLERDFGLASSRITVIPFGINNAVPHSELTSEAAKCRLGISEEERVILFFGRIVPYKGLEFLVAAFKKLLIKSGSYRLIIAGRPDNDSKKYCEDIKKLISLDRMDDQVLLKIEFVPDDETEVYFKAADVLALPYRDIYQSGVLFLAYSFGLPVVASDVGGLREEVVEGKTGFICRPENPNDLAQTLASYFESELYKGLIDSRNNIQAYARERYSWDKVSQLTHAVYAQLTGTSLKKFPCQGA